jgi:hypothetical protein
MANVPQGLAFWPGVGQVLRATYTRSQGITPSVCQLEIVPQLSGIAEHGTLLFTYGDVKLVFPDCKVDKASFSYNEQGMIWGLSIYDRRWKWAFDATAGSFNERRQALTSFGAAAIPSIDKRTEATPQQIAKAILNVMGEKNFDVSQLPNDARPEVYYDWDNPAQALAELCDKLGCMVSLGIDNIVRLVRVGIGALLPATNALRVSAVIDPPEKPDSLAVVGAKTRFQVDLWLEAVGLDVTGEIKPIEELSYKPATGWGGVHMMFWDQVAGWSLLPGQIAAQQRMLNLGKINPRELAAQSVYRWYRIKMVDLDGSGLKPRIPGWQGDPGNRLEFLWQILPIEDVQVEGWFDPLGIWHSKPAYVFGVFDVLQFLPQNTAPGSFCHHDFTVNKEQGIVEFSEPTFKFNLDNVLDPNRQYSPADLALRCAVNVQDATTRAWERYLRDRDLPGPRHDTGPRVLRREEILLDVIPVYDLDHKVKETLSTKKFCDREADYYLDAAAREYQTTNPNDATYPGIVPINPDGAIWQVTWSVGPEGAITRASRNTEFHPNVPPFRERRAVEKMRKNEAIVQRLQDQERRPKR